MVRIILTSFPGEEHHCGCDDTKPSSPFAISSLVFIVRWVSGCWQIISYPAEDERVSGGSRSSTGDGRLRSYLDPIPGQCGSGMQVCAYNSVPPGAVGGIYGSGCFQLSSNFSVSVNSACREMLAESCTFRRALIRGCGLHTLCCR